MEKALVINGKAGMDLEDIAKIARCEGKKVLGVDRVRVKPYLALYGAQSFVVVVEPENGYGCSKNSGVELGKKTMDE